MATQTILTDISNRTKPTFASSPIVGLTVRATGEEHTQIITADGTVYPAKIPAPTAAPVLNITGTPGNVIRQKYIAYGYTYAATTQYPYVENSVDIGGSVAPRSNPSPSATIFTGAGAGVAGMDKTVRIIVTNPVRTDLDAIWIFRSDYYNTQAEADNAGAAGLIFYIGSVAPSSHVAGETTNFLDSARLTGTDEMETDNFEAPTFSFVVFEDPYWWGFGNFPFQANASWATGIVTLTDATDKWFHGRDGQATTVVNTTGVTVFHGYFFCIDATHGRINSEQDGTGTDYSATGSGQIYIQGFSTTLYRSKARNPFSWGETVIIGDLRIPAPYTFKLGGGRGTGLFVMPSVPYLILSTESPASMYSLDLRTAGTTDFEASLRCISKIFSVTSHWSQFSAARSDGSMVMWGLDCKNFAILECDGMSVYSISAKVSKTLRNITDDPARQLLSHGAYEPKYQLNCLWFGTINSPNLVNFLIYQHAPTGNWFTAEEHDVLCSALYQDAHSNLNKIFVGTETGLLGQAFVEGQYSNWLPNPRSDSYIYSGVASSADATSITIGAGAFDTVSDGIIGNWALLTDAKGGSAQWARISGVSADTLSFDRIIPYTGGGTTELSPVPVAGWKFWIGVLEVSLTKYFNLSSPYADKKLDQIFASMQNVEVLSDGPSTILRFYKERQTQPLTLPSGATTLQLKQEKLSNGSEEGDVWVTNTPNAGMLKCFGVEIIDRSYEPWKLFDLTLFIKNV